MHSIFVTVAIQLLLISDAVNAAENVSGYKVAKKVPAYTVDKRQDGIFNQIDSFLGGSDGSSPFSGPGTGVGVTPTTSSSTTATPFVPISPISTTTSSTSSSSSSPTTTSRSSTSSSSTSSSSTKTSSTSARTTSSSVRVETHTSALVTSVTEALTTVYTTVSGSRTSAATHTTHTVIDKTTGVAVTTTTATLSDANSSGSGSSGLSDASKKIIGGVVGGVGGALLLAGIGFVLWRLYGRGRHTPEDEGLMSDRDYPYMQQRTATAPGQATSPVGVDRTTNANVNTAANF